MAALSSMLGISGRSLKRIHTASPNLALFFIPHSEGESRPPDSLIPGIPSAFLPLLLPVLSPETVCRQFARPTEGAQ